MFPELQKPRVTEIQVRMDCNGCVQKIKKVLNGVNGIYDLYIDFPQQKLTVIGWADPDKIVRAIKKTRKIATICSHIEPTESPSQSEESPSQPTEEAREGNAPAADATQEPPAEAPPDQAAPTAEQPKDTQPSEQPPPEAIAIPSSTPTENTSQQSRSTPGTKDVGEVHAIYHHPHNYGNRYGSGHNYVGHWDRYHNSPAFLQEPPQPIYVTHSYNTYNPPPYVTGYEYVRSPPRHTQYNRMEHYSGDYHNGQGNITSMFSDENPNACRIA